MFGIELDPSTKPTVLWCRFLAGFSTIWFITKSTQAAGGVQSLPSVICPARLPLTGK